MQIVERIGASAQVIQLRADVIDGSLAFPERFALSLELPGCGLHARHQFAHRGHVALCLRQQFSQLFREVLDEEMFQKLASGA